MTSQQRPLYFCVGPQSSGSTLISWCFLQRRDMDGILDADNDIFAEVPRQLRAPLPWIKTTISSFRFCEQLAYYQDAGWTVHPLLVCRDVRAVYASLRTKSYGRNGTTAEDPPLRLRLRRFREDWELFRAKGWPILQYERFLQQPEDELRAACAGLGLPWDEAMLTWPKPAHEIFDTRHGNEHFRQSCGGNLRQSLRPSAPPLEALDIPGGELAWLESEFAEYNRVNGYPAHVRLRSHGADPAAVAVPTFAVTRRYKWTMHQKPLTYLLYKIGLMSKAG
ncbi:MAG: sulfotransferase [Gemmataceae bacterium]|nr:sulfotransferase [Gemmataceae bacterium]